MARIWGFDIGTTSIGWAVIEHEIANSESGQGAGRILGMGVRIFPEARDPDGTPLNQTRRQKRMARRQLRRRRERRKALNQALADAGLLPPFSKDKDSEWSRIMALPPLPIRARVLKERVEPHELGRALYHLAKRRHFKGRDLEESDSPETEDAEEKAASNARERTIAELKATGKTLGEMLATTPAHERSRGIHALRSHVADEFERLWSAQAAHHPALTDTLKAHVADTIFAQKPVFWRKSTLGQCRLMPGEALAPKGSWLSQQRRMLEKLNNMEIASGNRRSLDAEERAAVLAILQTQASMTWGGVRRALKPLYAARGEKGMEQRIKFNLELGGEPKLLGNPLEAKLAAIFDDGWETHPHRQAIRNEAHRRLWSRDYEEVGQRVVIRAASERADRERQIVGELIDDFGISETQATALAALKLPTGWEPFSTKALEAILPELERGERFGTLMVSPERAQWREATFPNRDAPTGEILDKLPSPTKRRINGRPNHAGEAEIGRIKEIRNPTVARTQNELRKVVNNLIDAFGKPDLIRLELTRDVGLSKREREEKKAGIAKNRRRRAEARKDLEAKGILEPASRDIEKWVLWKEGQEKCPYTNDPISFDALFRRGEFEVEHIWPRSLSFDDSQGNKTLCRKDINIAKGNRTPFEFFRSRPDEWDAVKRRMDEMTASKAGPGFPRGKVRRFVAEEIPKEFTARQLVDTGYAAKQAVALLKRLWADVGEPNQAVDFGIDEELRRRKVLPVTSKVTAQLRKLWGLNNILSDDGQKTRADHRHHAVDALAVACADPGVTQRLSRYWQQKDDPRAEPPRLPPPWPSIRADAERAVEAIVVSHRVRKKVSGPLHEETIRHPIDGSGRPGSSDPLLVARKPVAKLTPSILASDEAVRDPHVRVILQEWIAEHGGDAKKAFETFPTVSPDGPPIKRVRVGERRQLKLMAPVANGYADAGLNHHISVYRNAAGKTEFEVVTLFEACRRISKRQPVVSRSKAGATFVVSFSLGETVELTADNGERTRWVVVGIEGDGRAALSPLNDARPGDAKTAKAAGFDSARVTFRPRIGGLMKREPRKISVDPIGRVRPAND